MSGESGADPGAAAPAPQETGRRSHRLPPWVSRRPRVAWAAAGVLAVAVIAGIVLVIVRPTTPQARYASLPGQSCALVNAADVAEYLPGAKGTAVSTSSDSTVRHARCKWSATANGKNRSLVAEAVIFRSASGVRQAQQSYHGSLSLFGCHCQGVTVSTKPVAGLGDQATQAFIVAGPTANFRQAPIASAPGTSLVVQSSNAVIAIRLDTTQTATGLSQTSPPSSAQEAGMVTMARDVLAVLARPASAVAPPPSSLAAEPRYTGRPDPCRTVRPTTLARYVPGGTVSPAPSQVTGKPAASWSGSCGWDSGDLSAQLRVATYSGAVVAQRQFQVDEEALSASNSAVAVTGMRWLDGLGEGAFAAVRHQNTEALVDVIAWSGNAEFGVSYSDTAPDARSPAETARLLAGATAMARDELTALASPAAHGPPPGPDYAPPGNACRLVTASTLARYAAGAGAGQFGGTSGPSSLGQSGQSSCSWFASTGDVSLAVTTYSGIDYGQAGLQFGISVVRQFPDQTIKRTQPVRGIGDQATAIFADEAGTPKVDLLVRSGNAVIDVTYRDPAVPPELSQAGKLAADNAIARDVLANLHRA
jgi:hypothetical protein